MRLPPEIKAELQKLADMENRSLTNYIETKLREIVRGTHENERAHLRHAGG